ncbi:MAG: ABC transporter substrate-binding protein [Nitriliruptorales bacterium]|nr:ABC transporter substrate-binding protein [Nitriliruptorales bacterium]
MSPGGGDPAGRPRAAVFAVGRYYDRVRHLLDDPPVVNGVPVSTMVLSGVEEVFRRMGQGQEFEISEMSFSFYTSLYSKLRDRCPFVALPVFLSRAFRHRNIFVRDDAVLNPRSLAGARIGLPEYAMTLAVWIRGILADDFGLSPLDVAWVTSREPLVPEVGALPLPVGLRLVHEPEADLVEMLHTGRLDVYLGPTPVGADGGLPAGLRRLFPDHHDVEVDYFRRTGIFPIMHVVVLRRDAYGQLGSAFVRSFCELLAEAKDAALRAHAYDGALDVTLPFLPSALDESRAILGEDPWPYGFDTNRRVVEAFLRYAAEQGLLFSAVEAHELFAPETLELLL